MNRKAEKFFDAITLLREDLVEEAQDYVFRKKRSAWKTFGSLAACLALAASLGLLVMPRGCGAADHNSSGGSKSDSCAPADMPQEAPGEAGDPNLGDGLTTAPAPEPSGDAPSGEAPPAEGEQLQFWGQVLEVREDGLLVEPFDDGLSDLGPVYVPTAGLEGLPEFYPGGVVDVAYGSIFQADGEAVAENVTAVWLVEP